MTRRGPLLPATLIALLLVVAGCGADERLPAPSPAPPAATPVEVVEAYLAALEAGDGDAARALCTERFLEFHDGIGSWFRQEVRFDDVVIRSATGARGSATDLRYRQAVYVPVTFVLTREHEDPTLPNGPTAWGYVLGRNRDSEPWRIDDHGT